ncbi:MAG: hypothetical protein KIT20_03325 [Alphaproteobacteria bacterium]|nr:hypothetical protein [Alphaproteobacteria bacterium]
MSGEQARAEIESRIAVEMTAMAAEAMPEARAFARELVRRHGAENVAAVLFYGSCLRNRDPGGLLDFYLLVDDYRGIFGSALLRLGNRLLPPNVLFTRASLEGSELQAKVAVISLDDFARAVGPGARDTTIWARFSQPVAACHVRDEAHARRLAGLLADAIVTATRQLAPLLPERVTARGFWSGLYALTFGAELRAERANRPDLIVEQYPARYEALAVPAIRAAGFEVAGEGEGLKIGIPAAQRRAAARRWRRERLKGKLRNLARLVKAVFTFEGAVDYALWKVERHAGVRVEVSDWQRRHPILAAPKVLWRLYRIGALR